MAKTPAHKWAFKPGMRAGLYSWRSSSKAIERLKSATSEIKTVNRADPVAAADGVVALAERIWPAFEHIDTSTGALGSAVYRTLTELVQVLIAAPASEPVRAKWLERLRTATEEDGVQYLQPISDRFGEIAVYRNLQNTHADRDLDMIRFAWADHASFGFVATATLTLSCLLEAGRHEELIELVGLQKSRFWSDDRFVAEALLRQGRDEDALAHAESLLRKEQRPWGFNDISRFCEAILVQQGREEEAYRRFGLPSASGNTYLAMWRDLVKRYPDLDARRILKDLMESHGSQGKWFAAAKTAKYLDIALDCAAQPDAAPATLIRAARDFVIKEPAFAAQVGLYAIAHLLAGRGYEPNPFDIDEAVGHVMAASARIHQGPASLEAIATGLSQVKIIRDWSEPDHRALAELVVALAAWVKTLPSDQMRLADIGVLCARRIDAERVQAALRGGGIETVMLQSGADDRSVPGVRITTMHRAKGLEFCAVATPFLSDAAFPPQGALRAAVDAADKEDIVMQHRSLLHVAATRAKKALRVSWSGEPSRLMAP